MENLHFLAGSINYQWPFSIAMFTRPGIQIYPVYVGLPDGKRMSTSHDWEYLGMVYTIPAIDIYGELGHGRHDMVLAT